MAAAEKLVKQAKLPCAPLGHGMFPFLLPPQPKYWPVGCPVELTAVWPKLLSRADHPRIQSVGIASMKAPPVVMEMLFAAE